MINEKILLLLFLTLSPSDVDSENDSNNDDENDERNEDKTMKISFNKLTSQELFNIQVTCRRFLMLRS